MASVFEKCGLYSKPVISIANHQFQQTDSYSMGDDGDELFEDVGISEMESDQSSLYSEGMSYEETSRDHNYDSYNSLDDQPAVDTCRTIGHDELVVPTHHKSLPSDSEHTTVCRYCREEVRNCYYDHHLITCSEYLIACRYSYGRFSIPHKKKREHYQEHKMAVDYTSEEHVYDNNITCAVNCIAIQETTQYIN